MSYFMTWSALTAGMVIGATLYYAMSARHDGIGFWLTAWGSLCAGIALALHAWKPT